MNQNYRRIIEVDREEFIEMRIMKEVVIGLKKDNIKITIEEMTRVAVVDLDLVQEQVPIEIELDAINVESMITLQSTVQHQNQRRK